VLDKSRGLFFSDAYAPVDNCMASVLWADKEGSRCCDDGSLPRVFTSSFCLFVLELAAIRLVPGISVPPWRPGRVIGVLLAGWPWETPWALDGRPGPAGALRGPDDGPVGRPGDRRHAMNALAGAAAAWPLPWPAQVCAVIAIVLFPPSFSLGTLSPMATGSPGRDAPGGEIMGRIYAWGRLEHPGHLSVRLRALLLSRGGPDPVPHRAVLLGVALLTWLASTDAGCGAIRKPPPAADVVYLLAGAEPFGGAEGAEKGLSSWPRIHGPPGYLERPHVCFVLPTFRLGGTEKQVIALSKGVRQRFRVSFICLKEAEDLASWASLTDQTSRNAAWGPPSISACSGGCGPCSEVHPSHRPLLSLRRKRVGRFRRPPGRRAHHPLLPAKHGCLADQRHIFFERWSNRLVDRVVVNAQAVADFTMAQERLPGTSAR